MINPRKILAAAVMLVLATQTAAFAASTDAGKDLTDKLDTACIDASELKAARIVWTSPYFDHQVAAIVDGKMPQQQMDGKDAAVLCLYDKQTGEAKVQDSILSY